MVQKITFILLLLLIVVPSFSQEDKLDIPTNRNYLEIDIKNILVSFSSIDIIYKRINNNQNIDKKNSFKLSRYQIGLFNVLNFNKPSLDETLVFEENYFNNINTNIGIGLEKEIKKNRFSHYYGIDFIGELDILNSIVVDRANADTYTIYYRDSNEYTFGVNPFLGVKCYLKKNLLVGLETGFLLAYRIGMLSSSRNNILILNGSPTENISNQIETKFQGIVMTFNNLRFLTIGYVF